MAIAIAIVGVLVALGWIPVFRHFWGAWRARNNPISLAICGLIGFMFYINVAVYVLIHNDPIWTASVVGVVNIAVLVNFYACFRWAEKIFPAVTSRSRRLTDQECQDAVTKADLDS